METKLIRILYVVYLGGVLGALAYPNRFQEHPDDPYNRGLRPKDEVIGYQGSAHESDVVNSDGALTDLERDLAKLLEDEPSFGTNERESDLMNELNDEQIRRGMSDIDAAPPPPPKLRLDEPSESDFESMYRRLENELNEDDSQFERNYMSNHPMANEFKESELGDFENEDNARGLNEDINADSFSDLNRRFHADDLDIMPDFEQSDDFVSDNKLERGIDKNAWDADFDDGSPNFANRFMPKDIDDRFLHEDFDENEDLNDGILLRDDANEEEMHGLDQRGYERFLNTMFGRSGVDIEDDTDINGDDTEVADDGPDDRDLGEGPDGRSLDDEPDDRGLDDSEAEILRRLVETILEKRTDGEAELDESDLEGNVDRF